MAPLADRLPPRADKDRSLAAEWRAALSAGGPPRTDYALRVAAVTTITVLIAENYQTLEPSLSAYLPLLMVKPERVGSIKTAVALMIVVALLLGALLSMAGALTDNNMLRLAAMAGLSLGLTFLASASKLGGLGLMVAMVAVYVIALMPMSPIGELTTRAFLHAGLMVAIPAGATIAVELLAGPSPRRLLERQLAADLRAAAQALAGDRAALTERLRGQTESAEQFLKAARLEKTSPAEDLAALAQGARATFRLMTLVAAGESAAFPASDETTRLAALLDDIAKIFDRGLYPVEISFELAPGDFSPEQAAARRDIVETLKDFSSTGADASLAPAQAKKSGFFRPDAFSNPAHAQFAAKTTLAALGCYWLYSVLDWSGVHTCLLTCYLIAEPTAAESIQKGGLRIVGCLAGSALGFGVILFVFPWLTSIGALLLLVGAVSFSAAWIAAGGERVAYAGLQFAFAFFIAALQGYGPGFDLAEISDRIIGILLGLAAGYLAFVVFWPAGVAARIEGGFSSLLREFSALASAGDRIALQGAASAVQNRLGELEKDFSTMNFEPQRLQPRRRVRAAQAAALAQCSALFGPVFLAALSKSPEAPTLAGFFADLPQAVAPPNFFGGPLRRLRRAALVVLGSAALAGCAASSIDMAPPAPDQAWTPKISQNGEILPGPPAPGGEPKNFTLPANPAVARSASGPTPEPALEPGHVYDLAELIDLAERNNPTTRLAWNAAREAALASGVAKSAYLPRVIVAATGLYQGSQGSDTVTIGPLSSGSTQTPGSAQGAISAVALDWLLFDFGARDATVRAVEQASVIANIGFNAAHQQVIYDVSSSFYAYGASRARRAANGLALKDALAVAEAAQARLKQGVGSAIEVAEAEQGVAQARLLATQAEGAALSDQVNLIAAVGLDPNSRIGGGRGGVG